MEPLEIAAPPNKARRRGFLSLSYLDVVDLQVSEMCLTFSTVSIDCCVPDVAVPVVGLAVDAAAAVVSGDLDLVAHVSTQL